MKYSILESMLHPVADSVQPFIENRFSIRRPEIEQPIGRGIDWQPTFTWQTNTGYICCEVSLRPYRPVIENAFAQIARKGLPVKGFIAFPSDEASSQEGYFVKDYRDDILRTIGLGFGLISVDGDLRCAIEHHAISIPLLVPEPDLSRLRKSLRTLVKDAYDTYINGDPASGLQKIGQLVEGSVSDLAEQAFKKGKFSMKGYKPGKYSPQGKLIVQMISQGVIDAGVLGRCRGFSDDRGNVSHMAKSITEAKRIEERLRDNFNNGLRILEELPKACEDSGFKFRV